MALTRRYWRIYVTATTDNYVSFQEIELRNVASGSDLTGSGTASASFSESGNTPNKAVDNNSSTFWGSYNHTVPQWWAYDFGAGNLYDILEIAITARTPSYYGEAGTDFLWQYSDDGINWFTRKSITGLSWSAGETKVINVKDVDPDPLQIVSQVYAQVEYTVGPTGQHVSQAYAQVEYVPGAGTTELDDGTSSGGLVVGGPDNVWYTDPVPNGGLVVGGTDGGAQTTISVDPPSAGGLVVGGSDSAQWSNPWSVAVKGGTYRIGGAIYTLTNTLYYTGIGDIAAIVKLAVPPATPGKFRYDILVIGIDFAIHVVAGAEAATPVMPTTTASHVLIKHILRYYGQARIAQSDIGRNYTAPVVAQVAVSASDDELAWAELTSTLTVSVYDQYGALYRSNVVVNAAFLTGNGTLAPMAASTATGTTTFLYTRGGADPGDQSPIIKFSVPSGAVGTLLITLLDVSGNVMT